MSVYVDDFDYPYAGMKMSHMIADSTKELLQMVDKIGVHRRWIQDKGTKREHFDVSLSKKRLAIKNGAILITYRKLATLTANRKGPNDKLML